MNPFRPGAGGSAGPSAEASAARKPRKKKAAGQTASGGVPRPYLATAPTSLLHPTTSRPLETNPNANLILPSSYIKAARPGREGGYAAGLRAPPNVVPGGSSLPPRNVGRRERDRPSSPAGNPHALTVLKTRSPNASSSALSLPLPTAAAVPRPTATAVTAEEPRPRRKRRIVRPQVSSVDDDAEGSSGRAREPPPATREEGSQRALGRGASMRRVNLWDDVPEADEAPPPFPYPNASTFRQPPSFTPASSSILDPVPEVPPALPPERERSPPPSWEVAVATLGPPVVAITAPVAASTTGSDGEDVFQSAPSSPTGTTVTSMADQEEEDEELRADRIMWNADLLAGYTLAERVERERLRRSRTVRRGKGVAGPLGRLRPMEPLDLLEAATPGIPARERQAGTTPATATVSDNNLGPSVSNVGWSRPTSDVDTEVSAPPPARSQAQPSPIEQSVSGETAARLAEDSAPSAVADQVQQIAASSDEASVSGSTSTSAPELCPKRRSHEPAPSSVPEPSPVPVPSNTPLSPSLATPAAVASRRPSKFVAHAQPLPSVDLSDVSTSTSSEPRALPLGAQLPAAATVAAAAADAKSLGADALRPSPSSPMTEGHEPVVCSTLAEAVATQTQAEIASQSGTDQRKAEPEVGRQPLRPSDPPTPPPKESPGMDLTTLSPPGSPKASTDLPSLSSRSDQAAVAPLFSKRPTISVSRPSPLSSGRARVQRRTSVSRSVASTSSSRPSSSGTPRIRTASGQGTTSGTPAPLHEGKVVSEPAPLPMLPSREAALRRRDLLAKPPLAVDTQTAEAAQSPATKTIASEPSVANGLQPSSSKASTTMGPTEAVPALIDLSEANGSLPPMRPSSPLNFGAELERLLTGFHHGAEAHDGPSPIAGPSRIPYTKRPKPEPTAPPPPPQPWKLRGEPSRDDLAQAFDDLMNFGQSDSKPTSPVTEIGRRPSVSTKRTVPTRRPPPPPPSRAIKSRSKPAHPYLTGSPSSSTSSVTDMANVAAAARRSMPNLTAPSSPPPRLPPRLPPRPDRAKLTGPRAFRPPPPPPPRPWARPSTSTAFPAIADEAEFPEPGPSRATLSGRAASVNDLRAPQAISPTDGRRASDFEVRHQPEIEYTDLDVLASRLEGTGREYEGLANITDFLGPGATRGASPAALSSLLLGPVEEESRRIAANGKVKLKLSLLGVRVGKCPICLSQFKENDLAVMLPACGHVGHEECARQWLKRDARCFVCREVLEEVN